jgi:hypothetical protein
VIADGVAGRMRVTNLPSRELHCGLEICEKRSECLFHRVINELFRSASRLAHCITVAKPWFELLVGVLGVGTFTLAAVLTWIIKKIRAESETAKKAYE